MPLVRISFRLDVVNDKKRVIVLFNLPVFVLLSPRPSPFPHSTKAHTDNTWEQSWQTHHPLLSDCWKGQDPPGPLDAEEWIILLECGLGQVEGSIWVKKAPWRHSCPLCCAVSFKSVCWQNSDNNSRTCAVFCLAVVIIFTERTSLLIKLFCPELFCSVFLGVFFFCFSP